MPEVRKYREKPVFIEAVRWDGDPDTVSAFLGHGVDWRYVGDGSPSLMIRTLEGENRCDLGDWILMDAKGEVYPCKPDIFDLTYEAVDA